MQRTRNTLAAGLLLGLLTGLGATAQAQTWYVPSSSYQTVPVGRLVVVTRSFGGSVYSGYSGYGSSTGYGYSQAWNSRTSAVPVVYQASYLPESSDFDPPISSRAITVSRPVVSSPVVSSRAVIVSSPRIYSRSIVSSQPVVYSEPIIYSEPVVYSQPVRVYSSVVASPRITREEIDCRPGHYEYEQKGKFEAFDGRRIKTYRYEYEVDRRPGRVKIEFDIDD